VHKKLEKNTRQLSEWHLNHLTLWLDGLPNADNLTDQVESVLFVTMPSESSKLCLGLIQKLSMTKQQVSKVLFSASHLRIEFIEQKDELAGSERRKQSLGFALGRANANRPSTGILHQQKKGKLTSSHHSTRIQIKCKN
jgi:hypothetical protein